MLRKLTLLAGVATAFTLAVPAPAPGAELQHLLGALHEHSGYSDGWPGSRPANYFVMARDDYDLNFLGSGEHSTNADAPFVFNEECYEQGPERGPQCLVADPVNPADSFRKWDATLEQANAETDPAKDFVGFRGFEWSSDRQGHINVYFSTEDTTPERDGGNLTMDAFYDWLTTTGSDGLATFNHPGDKSLCGQAGCEDSTDPAFNWEDFRYVKSADPQMVGIETFNGGSDFGRPPGHNAPPEGWYARALDRGWHVGAVGVEDKGHDRTDRWGDPRWAKTVILAPQNTRAALKAAMTERRFYAVLDNSLRLDFTVDGELMGARLGRGPGDRLDIGAAARGAAGPVTLELITSGGKVVATGQDRLALGRDVNASERWYFVRASRAGKSIGYSSPVWIEPGGSRRAEQLPARRGYVLRVGARRALGRPGILRRRRVRIAVRCAKRCRTDVEVRAGSRRLGRTVARLPAGRRRLVEVRLGGSAARRVSSRRVRALRVRVRARLEGGAQGTRTLRIRLR